MAAIRNEWSNVRRYGARSGPWWSLPRHLPCSPSHSSHVVPHYFRLPCKLLWLSSRQLLWVLCWNYSVFISFHFIWLCVHTTSGLPSRVNLLCISTTNMGILGVALGFKLAADREWRLCSAFSGSHAIWPLDALVVEPHRSNVNIWQRQFCFVVISREDASDPKYVPADKSLSPSELQIPIGKIGTMESVSQG